MEEKRNERQCSWVQEVGQELECLDAILQDAWDIVANVKQLLHDAATADRVAARVPVIGEAADGPRRPAAWRPGQATACPASRNGSQPGNALQSW